MAIDFGFQNNKNSFSININLDLNLNIDPQLKTTFKDIKQRLKSIKELIAYDIKSIKARDPAAKSDLEIVFLYSGFHAVLAYRVAHKLYLTKHYFSARAISQVMRFITGIEIHPGAKIGRGLFIDHGSGVVIGETTEIGDDCLIYQGVTLGGTGKDIGKRHPTLGNNVMVGCGARVLGPFKVGDNAKIAANAVVLKEVPDGATAVGIPARIAQSKTNVQKDNMDHVHTPDPLSLELCAMKVAVHRIEEELNKHKNEEIKNNTTVIESKQEDNNKNESI